jgi:hypothetical protein
MMFYNIMDNTLHNSLRCQANDIGCTYYIVDPYYKDRLDSHEKTCPFVKLSPLLKTQSARITALEEKIEQAELPPSVKGAFAGGVNEDLIAGKYTMIQYGFGIGDTIRTLEIDPGLKGGRFLYLGLELDETADNFRMVNGVLHFNDECEPITKYSGVYSTTTRGLITGTWTSGWRHGEWFALKK